MADLPSTVGSRLGPVAAGKATQMNMDALSGQIAHLQNQLDDIRALTDENASLIDRQESGVEPWQAVTYLNAWTSYGSTYAPAGYRKDSQGRVHLRGLVASGTIGTAIFSLPVGYRPVYRVLFVTISNSAIARCDVDTNGDVIAYNGSNAWFALDGLSFFTD